MQLVESVVFQFQLGLHTMDQHRTVTAKCHINQTIGGILLIAQSELQVLVDLWGRVAPVIRLVHDVKRVALIEPPHEGLVTLSVATSHLDSAHIGAISRVGYFTGIDLLQEGWTHMATRVAEQLVRSHVVV